MPQMSTASEISAAPEPPGWARQLARAPAPQFAIFTVSAPDTIGMDGEALQRATRCAYLELGERLRDDPTWHAVRIWNFLPSILARTEDGLNRYMHFNAGRYVAFTRWFGSAERFDQVVPAASAIGHAGADLVIHTLACRQPGAAVANPRQRAPHRYSRRFGPLPPCFARAMTVRIGSDRLLFVGGTASVRDESSVHVGDLSAQLGETFENLGAVARAGLALDPSCCPFDGYRALRIYHVRSEDRRTIESAVSGRFRNLDAIEWMQGDLCRGDLLVEIEGFAR